MNTELSAGTQSSSGQRLPPLLFQPPQARAGLGRSRSGEGGEGAPQSPELGWPPAWWSHAWVEEGFGAGEGCFQFPPLCYQLLGSTSTGHGQLLPSWESSQCQAGRLTQQNGRHMTVALRLPALLRWLSEEGGSYLLIPLPSLGCLLPFSEKVEGWGGLSAAWDSPQQD